MSYIQTPLKLVDPNFTPTEDYLKKTEVALRDLVYLCHRSNVSAGWWSEHINVPKAANQYAVNLSGKAFRNVPELLCLIHSEISEAMEGDRKDLMDDKLPQYKMLQVELIDAMIRCCDLLGALEAPAGEIMVAKLQYNSTRADHKPENRALPDGKKY